MSDLPEVECALCGLDGPPPEACDMCHGHAQVRPRAFTLSDVRTGKVKEKNRYGPDAQLEPKDSPLVVGGVIR